MTTNIPTCPQCRKQHVTYDGKAQACKGHKSGRPEHPCTKRPMETLDVCWNHGGASLKARGIQARNQAQQEARRIMATFGDAPTETDPIEGLHLAICWARTHMDWLRQRVQRLLPDSVVWSDSKVTETELRGLTVEQRAEIHSWVKLYNEERDRFVGYCARAISAGLAEREVRLEEARGALIAEIIRSVLSELELSPEQQAKALTVVPQQLRRAQSEPSMN